MSREARHWGNGPKKATKKNEVVDNVYDDDDEDSSEAISVWDAAEIWASNGKDEDYTFGYTEEELEDALR